MRREDMKQAQAELEVAYKKLVGFEVCFPMPEYSTEIRTVMIRHRTAEQMAKFLLEASRV